MSLTEVSDMSALVENKQDSFESMQAASGARQTPRLCHINRARKLFQRIYRQTSNFVFPFGRQTLHSF